MTLSQILIAIVGFLKDRLTNLKGHVVTLQGLVASLSTTVTNGLAARWTKTESDERYLGVGGTAVNSDKLGGKTLATVENDYTQAIGVAKAEALLVAKANVKRIFGADIVNGTTVNFLDLVAINGLQAGSSFELKFNGAATATMLVEGLVNASGGELNKVVSDGDSYIFDVVADGPSGTVNVVNAGSFFDSTANVKFAAIAVEQGIQDGRLDALEATIGDLDGTWATDASVDEKIRVAFDDFRIELLGMDYTDIAPN